MIRFDSGGTTFTQHIVYLILNGGVPVQPNERLNELFPHLEEVGKEFMNKQTSKGGKRLVKTHLPYEMTPQNPQGKYIFISRNPKDCLVSFFHHTRGFPKHYGFADGDFDVYFDLFIEGKVDFGSYFAMLRSWFDHKDDDNVLFLTYETLRRNTRETILLIARFISIDLHDKLLEHDERILGEVFKHSSLECMKQNPLRWCSERPSEQTPFIRNGGVGSWGEILTASQTATIDEMMKEAFTIDELAFLGEKY
jgi:hypothetical protein